MERFSPKRRHMCHNQPTRQAQGVAVAFKVERGDLLWMENGVLEAVVKVCAAKATRIN